jgi:hypothetical protein
LLASLSPARRRLLEAHLKPAERGVLVALAQTSQANGG